MPILKYEKCEHSHIGLYIEQFLFLAMAKKVCGGGGGSLTPTDFIPDNLVMKQCNITCDVTSWLVLDGLIKSRES